MVNDVLILGGGLAGGAAATLLAKEGIPVLLLERETGPRDKICGEFLSIEALRDLQTLGLDPARLGAVAVDRVRLVSGNRAVEAKLPFAAMGVSRKVLDEALLELAWRNGAQIQRGIRVTGLDEDGARTCQGTVSASRTLLATGKHEVRGARRNQHNAHDGYVGFKMHFRQSLRQRSEMGSAIELVLFEGGYAGLQQVGGNVVNLCLVLRQSRLNELGNRWEQVFAMVMREPHLAKRLDDAQALMAQPLTIANLPYGFICDPSTTTPAGVFRLGDQAAMTASLTGDGMALALRSAHIVSACLQAGLNASAYHRNLRRSVSRQVRRAMLLQRASELQSAVKVGFGVMEIWPGLLGKMANATRLPIRKTA